MLREEHQRPATLLNHVRCWISFHPWELVRCKGCDTERYIRADPVTDASPPSQECHECGSPSLWPIERQSTAIWCPGCDHDLLHQEGAHVAHDEGTANHRFQCRYCGTESCWHLATPAPIRLTRDAVAVDAGVDVARE